MYIYIYIYIYVIHNIYVYICMYICICQTLLKIRRKVKWMNGKICQNIKLPTPTHLPTFLPL